MDDTKKIVDEIFDKHKAAFELKDEITSLVEGHTFPNILAALVMVYTDVLMSCCRSEDEAKNYAAEFGAKVILAITAFSEEGLCDWSHTSTLQ